LASKYFLQNQNIHLLPMYGNGHLRADGLTPEISTGPDARSRVWAKVNIF